MTHTQSEDTMTGGWKSVKLGEIAQINPTETLKKGTTAKKVAMEKLRPYCRDIPEYELSEYNGGAKFRNGDTIMARITPCLENGKIAKVGILDEGEVGFGSTEFIVFRANEGFDEDFVYYLVCSSDVKAPAIKSMVGSSGRQRVQTDVVQNLQLRVPPLDVQRRIAAVLKPLDDKIELNAHINARLERAAQALFKRHFVRFEPYGGTMPPSWRVGTLSEIAHITMGQSPDGKSYNDKGIGTVFFQGRTDFGFRFPTVRLFTTEPKRMAKKRDVLLSVRAPVGDVNEAHEDCCIGRGLAAIQSKNGCQSFLLYTMFSLKKQLEVFNAEGTVFGCINRDSLNAMPILIPTDDAIKEFERIVAPMDEKIRSNTDESRTLARLRDVLLPRLMSGAVDVGQVYLNSIQEGGSR